MNIDIRLLKKGDTLAFERIVRFYWHRMNGFAMIYTRHKQVAEELVSDTFLSLWNNRFNLDEETRLVPYLMVVLRNKCINYLKSIRNEFISIEEMGFEAIQLKAGLYSLENDASMLLEEEDLRLMINKAMEALPEKTRRIFEMSRVKGLKNKDIAGELGLSVKTVEFHVTKALQHLKTNLPKDCFFLLLMFFSNRS